MHRLDLECERIQYWWQIVYCCACCVRSRIRGRASAASCTVLRSRQQNLWRVTEGFYDRKIYPCENGYIVIKNTLEVRGGQRKCRGPRTMGAQKNTHQSSSSSDRTINVVEFVVFSDIWSARITFSANCVHIWLDFSTIPIIFILEHYETQLSCGGEMYIQFYFQLACVCVFLCVCIIRLISLIKVIYFIVVKTKRNKEGFCKMFASRLTEFCVWSLCIISENAILLQ